MKLRELLVEAGVAAPANVPDVEVTGVTDNSREVQPGSLFVALRGTRTDSHVFVPDAAARGAAAVIVGREIAAANGICQITVKDSAHALGMLAHTVRGNPSSDMLVIGVSGTNGKTTTTFIIESILREAGYNPGVIGTIEYRYAGKRIKASNTTPSAVMLASMMSEMREAGVNAVAMEVSSHAIAQERIAGIEFDVAALTNITQDHLDYHRTMEEYAAAKKRLYFDFLHRSKHKSLISEPVAVFGTDNSYGRDFAAEYRQRKLTFGLNSKADLHATDVEYLPKGARFKVNTGDEVLEIASPLLGQFNVQNVLGAIAAAKGAGLPNQAIVDGIRKMMPVAGRFEQVDCGQDFTVIVDYAHTPDGLERVLQSAREMTSGRIVTVFGCGGDRDSRKRPIMGRIAGNLSDFVVVTNDNPRTENPVTIADMALQGVQDSRLSRDRVQVILDRRDAIHSAIRLAHAGDIVVIAGKGHEDYQILNSETIHFDDREVAREMLQQRVPAQ